MARARTARPPDELVLAYARLGVDWWRRKDRATQEAARVALDIDIADDEYTAGRAVRNPFRSWTDRALVLIPMPLPEERGLAFFAPVATRQGDDAVAFDLALVVDGGCHTLGFRFEPADTGEDQSHGYDHVQLSVVMGHRTVALARTAEWLPDSYPAFPLPSKDMRGRFLSMALAMHGFPRGVEDIVDRISRRNSQLARDCRSRINGLVGRVP